MPIRRRWPGFVGYRGRGRSPAPARERGRLPPPRPGGPPRPLRAATACFRAWLSRDKTRTVELRWTDDGREEHFVLQADAMDGQSMQELTRALGRRIAGEKSHE